MNNGTSMFPHRVREDVPSMGERAQKTGKEGATNSKDPNGKLSLKERKFKAWIIGEWQGRKDRGNGGVGMAEWLGQSQQWTCASISLPSSFSFPCSSLEKLGFELEGDPNVEK